MPQGHMDIIFGHYQGTQCNRCICQSIKEGRKLKEVEVKSSIHINSNFWMKNRDRNECSGQKTYFMGRRSVETSDLWYRYLIPMGENVWDDASCKIYNHTTFKRQKRIARVMIWACIQSRYFRPPLCHRWRTE